MNCNSKGQEEVQFRRPISMTPPNQGKWAALGRTQLLRRRGRARQSIVWCHVTGDTCWREYCSIILLSVCLRNRMYPCPPNKEPGYCKLCYCIWFIHSCIYRVLTRNYIMYKSFHSNTLIYNFNEMRVFSCSCNTLFVCELFIHGFFRTVGSRSNRYTDFESWRKRSQQLHSDWQANQRSHAAVWNGWSKLDIYFTVLIVHLEEIIFLVWGLYNTAC